MTKKDKNYNVVSDFIKHLKLVQYHYGADPYWQLIFSNGNTKWYYLTISLYNDIYYIHQFIGESANIEIHNEIEIQEGQSFRMGNNYLDLKYWDKVFQYGLEYIKKIIKNPLNTYLELNRNFPTKYRQGIIQKSLLWQFNKSLYRYDNELSKKEIHEFCLLVEKGAFNGYARKEIKDLTANQYFELCKIAYLSCKSDLNTKQKKLSGREMYKLFADGRHEGLLDIEGDSAKEFNQWINKKHPKYTSGGHPWEILRGGNSTHISLYVFNESYLEKNEYKISLAGHASNRLSETIRIAIGLNKKGYSVQIEDADLIRARLLGQDYIGIVPEFTSLHYSERLFETKLEDVLYLFDIKSRNKNLLSLIVWKELPFYSPKSQ